MKEAARQLGDGEEGRGDMSDVSQSGCSSYKIEHAPHDVTALLSPHRTLSNQKKKRARKETVVAEEGRGGMS